MSRLALRAAGAPLTLRIDAKAVFLPMESIWPSAGWGVTPDRPKRFSESDFDSARAVLLPSWPIVVVRWLRSGHPNCQPPSEVLMSASAPTAYRFADMNLTAPPATI